VILQLRLWSFAIRSTRTHQSSATLTFQLNNNRADIDAFRASYHDSTTDYIEICERDISRLVENDGGLHRHAGRPWRRDVCARIVLGHRIIVGVATLRQKVSLLRNYPGESRICRKRLADLAAAWQVFVSGKELGVDVGTRSSDGRKELGTPPRFAHSNCHNINAKKVRSIITQTNRFLLYDRVFAATNYII
jgi:hypothetical protein